jgi:methylmalonyl-CoA/ethylmalonyl-CoA epimerase
MKLRSIDHICIAVKDLEKARKIYEEDLGLELHSTYVAESEKIRVARYYVGEVALELMEATEADSDVGRFLEKRGEGFFLISYRVDDVDQALSELQAKGRQTIGQKPRELMGSRYAFIHHPRELGGVLTELIDGEFQPDDDRPA